MTEEQLDVSLAKVCIGFDTMTYAKIQVSWGSNNCQICQMHSLNVEEKKIFFQIMINLFEYLIFKGSIQIAG